MVRKIESEVLRDLSYGLYVLTSHDQGHLNGQIINAVHQVTNNPVRLAVTINKKNLTHELILKSRVFAVSALDNSTPKSYFQLFGFMSGRDVDKLANVQHKEGVTGCPVILENALSVLEAFVFKEVDLGTHTIFVGNAIATEVLRKGFPLTYRYYQEKLNGLVSKNAPTFIPA
ncbi:flavin reductase family protein [Thermodesulfobacteriota bacterium]